MDSQGREIEPSSAIVLMRYLVESLLFVGFDVDVYCAGRPALYIERHQKSDKRSVGGVQSGCFP